MLVRIKVGGELVEINTDLKRSYLSSPGEAKYYSGRLVYYLLKTINNIPRLYGYIKGDPVNGWKETFERTFLTLLTSDLDVAKNWFKASYEIELPSLMIKGEVEEGSVSAKVELKEVPQLKEQGLRANFEVDSFYFSRIERVKPSIIPAGRVGLLTAFSRFLVIQYEKAPGIPKAFGIAAEFINSMILPQGFSDEINGHKIYVDQEENAVYIDKSPIQNAPPDTLSLLALKVFLTRATESEFIIIEDPEAHMDENEIDEVKKMFNETKARLLLITPNKTL
ncbi:hypothetical protein [Stygiolobus caldivivus]|uniref:Uncharacterized protein n=1 Tax=Stygiolobus caldivivus TaxID=2824673 RepID=A0A8D5U6M2_9CREN|nr:hypothetical protein [Stygiolobus caldivivus]BCU70279.1 hypothetical protein KN1_15760 [Stygiolobus caldivivus]